MLKLFFSLLFGLLVVGLGWWTICFYIILALLLLLSYTPLIEVSRFLGFNIFVGTLSFSLCYLVLWLRVLMLISSCMILKLNNFSRVFVGFIYILGLVLLVSFLTSNYLIFYFFFEASLIPTLLIITGWGFQPERLQAGVYFIVYTLVGSLPLLVSLFFF